MLISLGSVCLIVSRRASTAWTTATVFVPVCFRIPSATEFFPSTRAMELGSSHGVHDSGNVAERDDRAILLRQNDRG